jgi:glycosyltransferase involved in cell wall biosynthesis
MTKRRLVVVSDYAWSTGGIEEFVSVLVAHMSATHDCRVVSWSTDIKLPDSSAGLRVVDRGDVRGLWEELEAADALLVPTSFNVRLLARAAGEYLQERPMPTIVVVQTSGHSDADCSSARTQEKWLRELASGSSFVVAVSSDVQKALARIAEFPMDRVVLIENAARLDRATPRLRERIRIAFIGRPHPQKGYHLFERLVGEFAGSGLEFAANTVSLAPPTVIPGVDHSFRLSDTELVDFFGSADLVLAPYLRADGLPLAILEALNCGVPVLGFGVPGLGELLQHHGQVVVEPTYGALVSAVREWQSGELSITEPQAGSVTSWGAQLCRYQALFSAMEFENVNEISRRE